jgi:hypothetical protein
MRLRVFSILVCSMGMLGFLSSCQRDATITVVGNGPMPEFAVEASGGEACVSSLIVYAAGPEDAKAPLLWRVGLIFGRGDADCRSRLAYGQTPAGYESDIPAKNLVSGKRYRVEAQGDGWTASKDWTPR